MSCVIARELPTRCGTKAVEARPDPVGQTAPTAVPPSGRKPRSRDRNCLQAVIQRCLIGPSTSCELSSSNSFTTTFRTLGLETDGRSSAHNNGRPWGSLRNRLEHHSGCARIDQRHDYDEQDHDVALLDVVLIHSLWMPMSPSTKCRNASRTAPQRPCRCRSRRSFGLSGRAAFGEVAADEPFTPRMSTRALRRCVDLRSGFCPGAGPARRQLEQAARPRRRARFRAGRCRS